MVLQLIKGWADKFFGWLEKFSTSRFWLFKSVLIIVIITLIYGAQNYPFMVHKKIAEQRIADSAIAARANDMPRKANPSGKPS